MRKFSKSKNHEIQKNRKIQKIEYFRKFRKLTIENTKYNNNKKETRYDNKE